MEHSSSVVACQNLLQAISAFPCPPGTSGRHNLHSYGRLNTTKMIIHKQGSDLCFNQKYLGMSDSHKNKQNQENLCQQQNTNNFNFLFQPSFWDTPKISCSHGIRWFQNYGIIGNKILYPQDTISTEICTKIIPLTLNMEFLPCDVNIIRRRKKSGIIFDAEYFQFAVLKINNSLFSRCFKNLKQNEFDSFLNTGYTPHIG